MVRIKMCGITREEDVAMCARAGADALGFVVEYPQPTPWTLTRERAAELMRAVPPFVNRVAVVGGDAATILEVCAATRPNLVQLHGDEPESVVEEVAAGLAATGVRLIKAVRVPAGDHQTGAESSDRHRSIADVAMRFLKAGADGILLDSKTSDRPAGTGRTFEWSIARHTADAVGPVMLAGGLTPENVGRAVTEVRPYGVDVITSLEDARHRKVEERVQAFVRAVRTARI